MILNFLRLGTLLPIRYILYESNSRKAATFAAAKFSFFKNHRDHKNEKNLNLPTPSFYSRDKQGKEQILIQVQPLKMKNKKINVGLQPKFSKPLRSKSR